MTLLGRNSPTERSLSCGFPTLVIQMPKRPCQDLLAGCYRHLRSPNVVDERWKDFGKFFGEIAGRSHFCVTMSFRLRGHVKNHHLALLAGRQGHLVCLKVTGERRRLRAKVDTLRKPVTKRSTGDDWVDLSVCVCCSNTQIDVFQGSEWLTTWVDVLRDVLWVLWAFRCFFEIPYEFENWFWKIDPAGDLGFVRDVFESVG